MAYTVEQLVTNGYYLAGIVSRDFQIVTGEQVSLGIDLINEILADKTIDTGMIPYFSRLYWNTIPGQPDYYFPNLISVSTLVFYIGVVRYAMTQINRNSFRGDNRAENIQSLPFNYMFERMLGGAMISVYFNTNLAYPMEMWGLFRLQQVQLNQDLEKTLDLFYINYLKYKYAQRLCQEYNYAIPENLARQLSEYETYIDKRSARMDITVSKISALSPYAKGVNYGVVNLGPWVPA